MTSTKIRESLIAVVAVYRKSLLIDIGHEEILAAVLIEIRGIHAHAGTSQAILAIPDSRREADLLEFLAAPVYEQKVRNRIVGLKQIQVAIVVDIRSYNSEAFSQAFQ